ncbi:MAG: nucleotidyltransferase domain-containing protein [Thermoprotei archaeon]|nr:MAG: nucleotidyltransferase domain-containing protein [Thermoprotei archaeon]
MDRGDLRRLAEGLLPRVADPIDALARIAEERGLDPPNPSGQLFRVFERHGVVLAYLFGSRARGTARRGSDYDFAVLFARDDVSVEEEIALALGLAEALGVPSDKVDVVALNRADPELIARVLKEGKLLYARSEDERRRWERRTLLELLRLSDLTAVYAARALKHVKRVGSRAEGQAPHS